MHVIFIPSWYPLHPGDTFGSFFREQAIALHQTGCKVGVLAPDLRSLTKPKAVLFGARGIRKELDQGVPTYRKTSTNWTPRIWKANARRIEATGWQLYEAYVADHGVPDVVHVHSCIMAGVVAQKIARNDGVPYVVSEHSTAYARQLVPKAGIRIACSVAEGAEERFAVSSPLSRILEEQLMGEKARRWSTMPNMVDKSFLEAPIQVRSWRGFRFLHVSLLDKKKNVDLILRAFAQKYAGDTDVSLTIGGDGTELKNLVSLAQELQIDNQVRFTGMLSRDGVRAAMAESDAFLLSSEYETFGIVLVEAMAMGLPVVATRCGGPEDIVTPQTGILVEKNNVVAFAEAMDRIRASKTHWSGQRLRDYCAAHYGPEAVTARWHTIYAKSSTHRTEPR